jgi:Skp family chaperone for outer membrane proteins
MSEDRKSSSGIIPSVIVSAIISLSIAAVLFFLVSAKSPHIAYIDTGKLMVGFSEANKVEKEVKIEDNKWQAELKVLQDSLEAQEIIV